MRWFWPFSWRWRISDLELQNAALKEQVRALDAALRASAISQACNLAAYNAAVASLAATVVERHRAG